MNNFISATLVFLIGLTITILFGVGMRMQTQPMLTQTGLQERLTESQVIESQVRTDEDLFFLFENGVYEEDKAPSLNALEEEVNEARKRNGLNSLKADERLRSTSRYKVRDMITHEYFEHDSPTGESHREIFNRFDLQYVKGGEILASGFETERLTVAGWFNSHGHKRIILDELYTHFGCHTSEKITACHFARIYNN